MHQRTISMPEKPQTMHLRPNGDLVAAVVTAGLVAAIGLLPHLMFANEIGALHYFHGAYDEDSYARSWLLGTLRSTRALSGVAVSTVAALVNSSIDLTLIASDMIFPFLATCAAYFAVAQVISGRAQRVLATLLLIFANDLFSLGNLAVWTSGHFNISAFSQIVGRMGPNLVPAYETSFLALFRTPEPQVSFILMFLILGLAARLAANPHKIAPFPSFLLIVATALLPFGYTFVTAPVAAILCGLMGVFALRRQTLPAALIAASLAGAVCTAFVARFWQSPEAQSGLATLLSYHSRRPIVTPAVIGSLIFGSGLGLWMLQSRYRGPLAFLALGCLLLPLLLSNQQIVTGLMISARDWERSISYSLLVFGLVTAASLICPSRVLQSDKSALIAWIAAAGCMLIVSRAQFTAFHMWEKTNLESIAIVRALEAVEPRLLTGANLTFADAGISQLIQVRMNDRVNVPLTFYKVATRLVPNMAPDARLADRSPYEDLVFEHWFRTGTSPEQAEDVLRSEIRHRAGTFVNYLFSLRDASYPASDNRAVRQVELEKSVGPIIARYRDYLRPENRRDVLGRPGLLISMESPTELSANSWIRNRFVASGEAHGMTAYVYRQNAL